MATRSSNQTIFVCDGSESRTELAVPADTRVVDVYWLVENYLVETNRQQPRQERSDIMIVIPKPCSEPSVSVNSDISDGNGVAGNLAGSFGMTITRAGSSEDSLLHNNRSLDLDGLESTSGELSGELNDEDLKNLKDFPLYSFMWLSFQWVEPLEIGNYRTLPRWFYKIMRLAVSLSLWCIIAFELFNLIHGFNQLSSSVQLFTAIVAVFHRFLWTFRYLIIHHLGLHFFTKHQHHVINIMTKFIRMPTNTKRLIYRQIQYLLVAGGIVLMFLPLVQKLIPIFIEQSLHLPRNWDKTVECIEFFVLIYSRTVAMPIFFFLIITAEVLISEIDSYKIQISQSKIILNDLVKKYVRLSTKLMKVSQAFQPFLIGLLFLLIFWGILSVYSSAEVFQKLPPKTSLVHGVVLSEGLGSFIAFLIETVFLFTLPFFKLGKVTSHLQQVISSVNNLDCEEQRNKGYLFDTEEKIMLFSHRLEACQKYSCLGFKILGFHMTELKSIWLPLLGPIIAFAGNLLLKEGL